MRPRPFFFAANIATLASRRSRSAVSSSPVDSATPMLAVRYTSPVASMNGSESAERTRSATIMTSLSSFVSLHSTASSSPPRRATESPARNTRSTRWATTANSSSPAASPRLSFTTLKWSRSMRTRPTLGGVTRFAARVNESARSSSSITRLGSSVSGS